MGDLLNDINLDIIPSFAPARSSSPAPDSDSPSLPTNSQTTPQLPPLPSTFPGTAGGADGSDNADTGATQSSPSTKPGGSPSTTPPTTNNGRGSTGSSTDTVQSSPPANSSRNGHNGTLSVQPKPAALVGTTGSSSNNSPKAPNTNNGNVDGTAAASSVATGGVPIGAILGSVLAGVIMITLAVTLLVAMRRKSRARRQARIQPMARNRSYQGRAGLMELGAKEEDDAWNVEAPKLPPLQLNPVSPTLDMGFAAHKQPSPILETLSPPYGASQQRPDSVGSIQDAPMNYFVALEDRGPRADLRVMNRASNASADD